jgi:hypothetical protein
VSLQPPVPTASNGKRIGGEISGDGGTLLINVAHCPVDPAGAVGVVEQERYEHQAERRESETDRASRRRGAVTGLTQGEWLEPAVQHSEDQERKRDGEDQQNAYPRDAAGDVTSTGARSSSETTARMATPRRIRWPAPQPCGHFSTTNIAASGTYETTKRPVRRVMAHTNRFSHPVASA